MFDDRIHQVLVHFRCNEEVSRLMDLSIGLSSRVQLWKVWLASFSLRLIIGLVGACLTLGLLVGATGTVI